MGEGEGDVKRRSATVLHESMKLADEFEKYKRDYFRRDRNRKGIDRRAPPVV